MGQVQIDLVLAEDAHLLVDADIEDLAGGDVAGDQVAVGRVLFFQEVPALAFRDGLAAPGVAGLLRHPDAPALAARRLGHQPQLVQAGDGGRVDLDELAVGVPRPLLVDRRGRRAGVHDRVGGAVVDDARPAGRQHHGVGPELLDLHGAQVLGDDALAHAVVILDDAQELPELVLRDLAVGLCRGAPARPARTAAAGPWSRPHRPCGGAWCRRSAGSPAAPRPSG